MGPRAKRAQEAEPRTWAPPLSRGRGRGGGASECFLNSAATLGLFLPCFCGPFCYPGHTLNGRAALLRGKAPVPLKIARSGDSGCVVEKIQRMSSVSDLSLEAGTCFLLSPGLMVPHL